MRDPTVRATAAAEAKRVRDAIDYAKRELWVMINQLYFEDKNPAKTTHYQAVSLAASIVNQPGKLGKIELPPDTRGKIILALKSSRPPLRPKQGRRKDRNTLRNKLTA